MTSFSTAHLEPAVVLGAATTRCNRDPLICVKIHSTGAVVGVSRSSISQLPACTFLPGEEVRRSLFNQPGQEERAKVRVPRRLCVVARLPTASECMRRSLACYSQARSRTHAAHARAQIIASQAGI